LKKVSKNISCSKVVGYILDIEKDREETMILKEKLNHLLPIFPCLILLNKTLNEILITDDPIIGFVQGFETIRDENFNVSLVPTNERLKVIGKKIVFDSEKPINKNSLIEICKKFVKCEGKIENLETKERLFHETVESKLFPRFIKNPSNDKPIYISSLPSFF